MFSWVKLNQFINEGVLLVCLSENVLKPQNAMINHKVVPLKWPHGWDAQGLETSICRSETLLYSPKRNEQRG